MIQDEPRKRVAQGVPIPFAQDNPPISLETFLVGAEELPGGPKVAQSLVPQRLCRGCWTPGVLVAKNRD